MSYFGTGMKKTPDLSVCTTSLMVKQNRIFHCFSKLESEYVCKLHAALHSWIVLFHIIKQVFNINLFLIFITVLQYNFSLSAFMYSLCYTVGEPVYFPFTRSHNCNKEQDEQQSRVCGLHCEKICQIFSAEKLILPLLLTLVLSFVFTSRCCQSGA